MNVGYARVSTDKQTINLQMDALSAAGCDRVFRDEGVSGMAVQRDGLEACLESLIQGDVLIVYKLDRLGRSLEHLIETTKKLEDRGIGFRSITEGFDTTTPAGKMIFHVIGALAQFERELIKERVMAGLEAAKARGVKLGRRNSIAPEVRAEALRMYEMDGQSYKGIGKALGISVASAHRLVSEGRAA